MMMDPEYQSLFDGDLLAIEEQHEQFNRPSTANARRQQTDFFKKLQVCMMMFQKCKGRKAVAINPRSVGCWFRTEEQKLKRDTSPKESLYNLNKKESVEQGKRFLSKKKTNREFEMFSNELARRKREGCCAKEDDMFEAERIARYTIERHVPNKVDQVALSLGCSTYLNSLGEVIFDMTNTVKKSEF